MTQTGSRIDAAALAPELTPANLGAGEILFVRGDWTIETMRDADRLVTSILSNGSQPSRIDLSGLEGLDTSGAWALVRLLRGFDLELTHASPIRHDQRTLFDAVWATNRVRPTPERPPNSFIQACDATGRDVIEIYNDIKILAFLMGSVISGLFESIFDPRKLRITAIIHHLEQTGLKAVPIVAIMSFLVGAIVAQQGAFQLKKFGAEPFVIDLVGILVLREVGILLTAILVAGRSGSAFTAEIGSMKMREEVDAMRVMGLNVTQVLITPRVVALVIALPLLGMVANVAALTGGGLLLWVYSDITPVSYINWLREAVAVNTFMVGVIKAPFMALIIALISCSEGLQVGGSAESLGQRTTAAVVKSIFLMVLVDGIFAIFFAAIGY